MIRAIRRKGRRIDNQLLISSVLFPSPCSCSCPKPNSTALNSKRGIYSVAPNTGKNLVQAAGLFVDKPLDTAADQRSTFGVFKESETDDVDVLVNNYTAPALARALRERETTLHNAAHLVETGNIAELSKILRPFLKTSIDKRRNESFEWDISNGLTRRELILVQRQLHRMPREVFQATSRRASVVIPLCNVSGTAKYSLFFIYVFDIFKTSIDATMFLSSIIIKYRLDFFRSPSMMRVCL